MPHDHDDPEDISVDLAGWLKGRLRHIHQPGGGHAPGPDLTPSEKRGSGVWARLLVIVVLAVLAGFGWEIGHGIFDHDEPRRQGIISTSPRSVPSRELFAQREVRIHIKPFGDSAVVHTLSSGERVLAGKRDGRRWTQVFDGTGQPMGYVYENHGNLGPAPPGLDSVAKMLTSPGSTRAVPPAEP